MIQNFLTCSDANLDLLLERILPATPLHENKIYRLQCFPRQLKEIVEQKLDLKDTKRDPKQYTHMVSCVLADEIYYAGESLRCSVEPPWEGRFHRPRGACCMSVVVMLMTRMTSLCNALRMLAEVEMLMLMTAALSAMCLPRYDGVGEPSRASLAACMQCKG